MTDAIIEAKNLTKEFKVLDRRSVLRDLLRPKYKIVKALNNVSLRVEGGEFIGIIGPNGAGKSTLIKTLTGILVPKSGHATVMDLVPYEKRKENAKNIGVVFGQKTQLWMDIPVRDTFELFRNIYKIPKQRYNDNIAKFSEILGIDKYLDKPVRKLSLGERMRCDLAASLLHDPKIVFLDEPTIGLDVEAKFRIREFLKEINAKGTTIILTTHDMGDIEELCMRIAIIDKGKKIYDGLIDDIKKKFGTERILVVDFQDGFEKRKLRWKGVRFLDSEDNRVFLGVDTKKTSMSDLIKKIIDRWPVGDISIEEPKVEEIIRKIYREGI
jgi:ABC-2 type transport system ATP-binding protein